MNIIEKLNWRYATKKFDTSKKLTENQLNTLLEAINLTPTSLGFQPFKIIVVENQAIKDSLVPFSYNQTQVSEASHLIVFAIETKIDKEYITNILKNIATTRNIPLDSLDAYKEMASGFLMSKSQAEIEEWSKNQAYIALGNLLTTCSLLEIDSCPMEGFSPTDYDQILGLNELNLKSVVISPVGFRSAEDNNQKMPKVRKSLDEIIIKK